MEVLLTERFKEALGRGEEFLGGVPLLLAEAVEAAGPVGGVAGLRFGLGLELLLEKAGVEGMQTAAPVKPGGPVLDGAELLAERVGHRLVRAGLAELKEGDEGVVGARGLARGTGEEWLRVES